MEGSQNTHLNWTNVAIGVLFIIFDATVSLVFRLDVGTSLITAASRCILQLSVMALVLGTVFETNNPWAVAGVAILLNLLGTFETVFNKSKRRYHFMFPSVLVSMACSTIPVSLLGARFAMSVNPVWKAEQYIPIVGMLCGSTISGIVVATTFVLRELHDNRDKVEMYLAFGASRIEACRPVAQEALKLALLPTVNQMSVIGLISIPGMMTGALLGGSSVEQAAKLQSEWFNMSRIPDDALVIMFMISASTALAAIVASVLTLSVVVDNEHRVRVDRITDEKFIVWQIRDSFVGFFTAPVKRAWAWLWSRGDKRRVENNAVNGERRPLLG